MEGLDMVGVKERRVCGQEVKGRGGRNIKG